MSEQDKVDVQVAEIIVLVAFVTGFIIGLVIGAF